MGRIFRTLTALAAWAGLGIQLWLLVTSPAFASPLNGIWRFFAFFTILTNLLVAVVMSVSALAPASGVGRFVDTANARAAVLLYIATVGIIYHLLLAGLWKPQGWQYIADLILHSVTPVMVLAGWLLFDRKDSLSFRAIPYFLIYPIGYTLYALARGAVDGFYPYPFIDAGAIGYPKAFANIAGLTGAFVIGSGLIIAAGKALASFGIRRSPAG